MTRLFWLALPTLLAGCDFVWRLDTVELPRGDAAVDDDAIVPDAPDGGYCLGGGMLRVCFAEPPQGTLAALGTIDTTDDPRCQVVSQPSGPDLCVLAYGSITINTLVTATGSRPLVLVADDAITVSNIVDVSSSRELARTGAGARSTCNASSGGSGTTGAGGAGGTFGFAGGPGGSTVDAVGGGAAPPTVPPAVVGGCAGGSGGSPGNLPKASGGAGGGAIHLIARNQIQITTLGRINASGAGGHGGVAMAGGGGGGAGGWIGLDAPTVTIDGAVFARGGGAGGGGGTSTPGGAGFSATDPEFGANGGTAGNGNNNFGAPGCGGPDGREGGNPANPISVGGGGGGGGGCGIIHVRGVLVKNTDVSPAITQSP